MPRRSRVSRLLRWTIGTLVVVACFYFLVAKLAHDWHKIPWNETRLSVPLLVSAFLVMFIWMVVYGLTWKVLLQGLGERISLFNSVSVLAVSQIGKYIPGKLWFTVGRMYLAKKHGVSEAKTAVSTAMEIALSLLGAVVLFALAVALVPRGIIPSRAYLAFLLAPLCVVAVYPPVLNWATGLILKWLRQPVFRIRMSFARLVGILGLYVCMWIIEGLGCYLLVRSFYPIGLSTLPMVAGAFALSWILGFIVLISPAGLGVRESIFTFALQLVMPVPIAIIAALLSRIWITGTEGLLALVFTLLPRLGKLRAR
ncbi:MAG TPA: lysylphosphatidylglycerol synthase transmembrane domain-containing protein [bacterium]|nr:lysylphosphatidylglycerol synthase transmembrane domain-containing protein [bacterium]